MKILVCPLSRVNDMVQMHRPDRVISMLDPERPFPDLGAQYVDRHLRLAFHDVNVPSDDEVGPSSDHVRSVLRFVEAWDRGRPILIHCRAGISRSTAAAYVVACAAYPESDEYAIAAVMRQVAPLARPNETLVTLADAEMGRGGRMRAAIAKTGRDLPWIDINEGEPFVMDVQSDGFGARGQ